MLKKLKNIISNNKPIVITFIISLFIITFIYNLNDVSPYGNKSLLCVDFFHQYGPMLGGLYNKITKFENIIYSFNVGLGIPFFRNFLNYLSSPFNIILFFFSKENLLTSYSYIIGLKAIIASTNMLYYLNKKFKRNDLVLVPLAISYGFMQYFQAYYWNIMWLDGLVFLPLIILGIENIINDNKWKLYFVSLAIMLFSNYFIGYMICIYSCIYFIFYLIYKTKFNLKDIKSSLYFILKKSLIFAFSSFSSGAIIAFVLLPMFSSMFTISATGGSIPTSQYYLFNVKDFIISHLSGVNTTVFASDDITSPNISCGILSVILLLLFIINPKIKLKTKIIYSLILGFIIFAFFNPALDYIMHAFHVPNDLPYRYSFLYSFTLIVMCAYSLINIKDIKFQMVTIIFLLLTTGILYLLIEPWNGISENMLWINIILLIFYYILYVIYKYLNFAKLYSIIGIILFTSVGIIISVNYNWDISQEIEIFYINYDITNEYLNYLNNTDNTEFYRLEFTNMLTLNDGEWYDYNGVNTFSSMAYEDMAIFQNRLGIPGNEINSYYYQQTTPIYDLLFNVKYLFGDTNDYTRYITIKDEDVHQFEYTNGLIFGVKNSIFNTNTDNRNPFKLENELMYNMTGTDNILTESKFIKTEELYDGDEGTVLKYTYKNNFDNMYFYTRSYYIDFIIIGNTLYYIDENYSNLSGLISNLEYSYVDDYNERRIINISTTEKNLDIIIGYNNYYSDEFYLYNINHGLFENAYNYLKNYQFEYTKFKNNDIEGYIEVDDSMAIYTSIPYDDGWKVYVDGEKIETEKFANSLLTFKLDKGKHKIKIVYTPPYLLTGICISIATLIIIILRKKVIKLLKI